MTKKNKQQKQHDNDNDNVNVEDKDVDNVITSEDIAYMSDEEIRNLQDLVRRDRDYCMREGYNARFAEEMTCYIQRELGIRENRRGAHAQYLKNNGIIYEKVEEKTFDSNAALSTAH